MMNRINRILAAVAVMLVAALAWAAVAAGEKSWPTYFYTDYQTAPVSSLVDLSANVAKHETVVPVGPEGESVALVTETSYAPAVRIVSESEARLTGSGAVMLKFSSGAFIEAVNGEAKAYALPDFEASTLTTAEGERINLATLVEEHRQVRRIREVLGE